MQIINCFPCQCVGITDVLSGRSRMQMDHQVLDCVQAIAIFVQEGRIGVAGCVENIILLRNWKNIEKKPVTGCELVDFLYSASVAGKQSSTEY